MSYGERIVLRRLRSLSVACFALAGCRTLGGGAQVKVINGVETSQFPAVVLLNAGGGTCTGTFLGPTTLITAAHRIKSWREGNHDYPAVGDTSPLAVFFDETFFSVSSPDGAVRIEAQGEAAAVLSEAFMSMARMFGALAASTATETGASASH